MEQSDGVAMTIIGVVTLIAGFRLKEQLIQQNYSWVSNPYGWLLIAIGAAVAILGIGIWTSSAHRSS